MILLAACVIASVILFILIERMDEEKSFRPPKHPQHFVQVTPDLDPYDYCEFCHGMADYQILSGPNTGVIVCQGCIHFYTNGYEVRYEH